MADPVNATDVLVERFGRSYEGVIAALLACGAGDPVVIMPDGTLRRAQPDDGWEVVTAHDGLPSLRVRDDLHRLTDPVRP